MASNPISASKGLANERYAADESGVNNHGFNMWKSNTSEAQSADKLDFHKQASLLQIA